jgi:hypothetical protein
MEVRDRRHLAKESGLAGPVGFTRRPVTPQKSRLEDIFMPTATAEKLAIPQRGSANAIKEIIKLGRKISVAEMTTITERAEAAGGSLVALEPDGEECGTGQLHFKWPIPKKEEFLSFLETLVELRVNHEVLINGIVDPRSILVKISRQTTGF